MRKRLLFFIFGLMSMIILHAKKIDGIIIYNSDSISHVTFDIKVTTLLQEIDYKSLQNKVKYYNLSNKKIKLIPDQIKEIQFKYEGEDVRMISCKDNLNLTSNNCILLKIKIDGKLKLYTHYASQGPVGMYTGPGSKWRGNSGDVEIFTLQKKNGNLFRPRLRHFIEDMKEYLSDCPILIEKIDKKTYTIDSIDQIVKDYNSCTSKE
jgi:hypothetical protein